MGGTALRDRLKTHKEDPRSAKREARRRPLLPLVAHRGYALRYPENTRRAIRAALRAGARFVEVDVQLSSDGVPFLFHDRDLVRLCGVPGAIHERTCADLRRLRAAERKRFGRRFAREPIATLSDLVRILRRHPRARAFVEIKRLALERFGIAPVLDGIREVLRPVARRCILISFSKKFVLAARESGWRQVGAVLERWSDLRDARVRAARPEYIFCNVERLPRGGLRTGRARLVVYEVGEPGLARDLLKRGASLIETFAIREMAAAFSSPR
ncbi:MAG: glycerophosphodiester phosphodiesterase [Planctomycetes bacterium]|nr:glycerophosphodiester phosphodiesterase [Planctomycetota bacterium]